MISGDTYHEDAIRLTCSFSGLSEMSFMLLDVRFRWVVVGLSIKTTEKLALKLTFIHRGEGTEEEDGRDPRKDSGTDSLLPKKRRKGIIRKRSCKPYGRNRL